jgi:chromate transporter
MVLQFVGFLAGWNHAGLGMGGAVLGGLIATYFTFLPSFAWILLCGPSVERVRGEPRIAGALAAVTAAVVGVMANLGVWFAVEVIRDPWSLGIAVAAFFASVRLRWGVAAVVLGAAGLSLIRHVAGLG